MQAYQAVSASKKRRSDQAHDDQADSGYGGSDTMSMRDGERKAATHAHAHAQTAPSSPTRYPRVMSPVRDRKASIAAHATSSPRKSAVAAANSCQLQYNADRLKISQSITSAQEAALAMKDRASDADWPLLIPVAPAVTAPTRPGMVRAETIAGDDDTSPRSALKRSSTTLDAPSMARPQVAESTERLQLLNPEVLMHAHGENIIDSINPKAIGEIMERQFAKTIKHLRRLAVRVEDTSSKVLVTGDLNAGKSTFCNALLRQAVMPVDQQPCTEVFCEVLDARDNTDRVEVHGVAADVTYDREDPATYAVVTDLTQAVVETERYASLKVYVDDVRAIDESLLRNGVVDISLIDAPGLNSDSLKTTAIYARQEEIDVVVFVVSAENHLTLSAKEFLWNAANEKAYLFVVVNKFDNIRDKDRCRRLILDQIAHLSPKTHADAAELVHFVSASRVVDAMDADDESAHEGDDAFAELEVQLRNFVLDKRAQSKLAPAKTFCSKFWADMLSITSYNGDRAAAELAQLEKELLECDSQITALTKARAAALDEVSTHADKVIDAVRGRVRGNIQRATKALPTEKPEYAYRGIYDCYEFAARLRDQYMRALTDATIASEQDARQATAHAVDAIRDVALAHLTPEQYKLRPFNAKLMFSRKRDAIGRQVPVELAAVDFVDLTQLEAVLGTSSLSAVLVLYGTKTVGWSAAAESLLRLLHRTVGVDAAPRLLAAALACIAAAAGVYLAKQVPTALQRNLARKCATRMHEADYAATQAARITGDVRRVLQTPELEMRTAFARVYDVKEASRLQKTQRAKACTATADFFKSQHRLAVEQQRKLLKISF